MRLVTLLLISFALAACRSGPTVSDEATKRLVAQATTAANRYELMIRQHEASGDQKAADRRRTSASHGMQDRCARLIAEGDLNGAEAYLEVFDDAGLALSQDVDRVHELIAAKEESLEREGERLATFGTFEYDATNSLAYLGFTASKRLFVERDVTLYAGVGSGRAGADQQGQTYFVAIHSVDDDAEVLEIEHAAYSEDGSLETFTYSEDELRFYAGLCDRLKSAAPVTLVEANGHEQLSIDHYTEGALSNTIEGAASPMGDRALPLMRMSFFRPIEGAAGGWQPNFERMKDGVFIVSATLDGANSLAKATAQRSTKDRDLLERRRWLALSPREQRDERLAKKLAAAAVEREKVEAEERARAAVVRAEEKAKYEAEDPALRAAAKEHGLVYRDWSYWADFQFGAELRSILNGSTVQVGLGGLFPWLHQNFISQYFLDCRSLIPEGSPGFDIREDLKITEGMFVTIIPGKTTEFRVKRRLFDMYTYYSDNLTLNESTGLLEQLIEMRDIEKTQKKTKFLLNVRRDIVTLYLREACDSGFMRQFEENLYRIAHGLPSLQTEAVVHPYLALDR